MHTVVIADDFTGANATGVLLKKQGFPTLTILDIHSADLLQLATQKALSISTNSRSIPAQEAYQIVRKTAEAFSGMTVQLFAKRIDSTLRGNLGFETDALLDCLGPETMAFVVPCYPQASRTHVGGYLLVNGIPLNRTAVIHDPKNPVFTSKTSQLYQEQSRYPVASLYLEDLELPDDEVVAKLQSFQQKGIRSVIFDAVSDDDLKRIAQLAVQSRIPFISVDPGPFTAAATSEIANLADENKPQSQAKVLLSIGSVNDVTRQQLHALELNRKINTVLIQTGELLMGEERRQAEMQRVATALLTECDDYAVNCMVGCGLYPEQRVDFAAVAAQTGQTEDELSHRVNDSIAEITDKVLSAEPRFKALYTSGGDITIAVGHLFGSSGMRLMDEVEPLAAFGILLDGKHSGMKMVTKGGMAGDGKSIIRCVDFLLARIEDQE